MSKVFPSRSFFSWLIRSKHMSLVLPCCDILNRLLPKRICFDRDEHDKCEVGDLIH